VPEENIPMSKRFVLTVALLACAVATTASAAPRRDSDHDGLRDRAEKHRYHTNPHKKDTDGDRLRDGREVHRYHTNPREKDTDGDGFKDRREIRAGTNPRKRKSHPRKKGHPAPSGGFPNASNTGVPGGTKLSAGPSTISKAGTVVEGKSMGCVRLTAPGVVIRKSKISCAGNYAVYVKDTGAGGAPVVIQDSEIDCKNTNGTGIGEANFTVRRVNIHGCENGGDLNQNILVQDSYIHDLYNSAAAHTDGLQLAWGHIEGGRVADGARNITISHNTIFGMGADGSFGTSAIISNGGNAGNGRDANILIQNNLLAGGAYALYCDQDGVAGSNFRVLGNRFTRQFKSSVGFYGVADGCGDETQSGNVIHETGKAIRLH
jgi:hypothetical protein